MAGIDPMYNLVSTILDEKEVVIFLGGGASMEGRQGDKPYPGFDGLIDRILAEFGLDTQDKIERIKSFYSIIEIWEKEKRLAVRLYEFLDGDPGPAHYCLAALSIALYGESNALLYLSKNFDDLMKKAFTDLERNTVRRFNTIVIPLRQNLRGSEYEEIINSIDAHTKAGRPVILKLFGDLSSQSPILRQDDLRFDPEKEKLLIEWMKKPMIVIGYSFSDEILREFLFASRGVAPIFLVNPLNKIPDHIKNLDRVHHIKSNFSRFMSDLIQILAKQKPMITEKVNKILESSGFPLILKDEIKPAITLPGFEPIMERKRILILAADPKTTSRLRLDEEIREIEEGLRLAKHRDQFEIHSRWAMHLRDLRRFLLDVEPHIVHFIGYGEKDGLMTENESGFAVRISTKALSGLFSLFSDKVECVIMSDCYSKQQAAAINKHIPYVIGIPTEIKNKAIREFALSFYDALGAGRSVEDAFKFGRAAILGMFLDLPEHLIPVLIMKNVYKKDKITKRRTSTDNEDHDMEDIIFLSREAEKSSYPIDIRIDLWGQSLFKVFSRKIRPKESGQWLNNALDLAHQQVIFRLSQLKTELGPENADTIAAIMQIYGHDQPLYNKYKREAFRISQLYYYSFFLKSENAGIEEIGGYRVDTFSIGVQMINFAYLACCFYECLALAEPIFELSLEIEKNGWFKSLHRDLYPSFYGGQFLVGHNAVKASMKTQQYSKSLDWAIRTEPYADSLENAWSKSDYFIRRGEVLIALGKHKEGLTWVEKGTSVPGLTPDETNDANMRLAFAKIQIPGATEMKKAQIDWRYKLWRVLSLRSDFDVTASETIQTHDNTKDTEKEKPTVNEEKKELKGIEKDAIAPEKKGEELEKSVFHLFQHLLERCEEESSEILNARQQDRGRQRGHDLKFVVGITGSRKLRILIECKNVSENLKLDDIAGKLLAAEGYHHDIPIDHWILVSPNANISNELDELIELWDLTGKYPFKVQAWTPATRVQEFFGIIPGIYDKFIEKPGLETHPQNWSGEYKQKILESWKQKLEPPLRLPQGWEQYLKDPGKVMLEFKESDLNDRYKNKNYVEMNCCDETGAILPQTLEEKILNWLDEPVDKSPTIFLLGEFGDGKTFFTYILTRKLLEKFQKSPKEGWIPVRFALKNYTIDGLNNPHDFLRTRLEKLGLSISSWEDLRREKYKLLVILDGFDEISKELDPNTIQRNIDILIELFGSDYFSGLKILITSRKHFFESQKDKAKLIDKLHYPKLIHLAPIDRRTTENYLNNYAERIGAGEKFKKLKEFHDPIGMASKPLFLEMAQTSLKDLPEQDLNECVLYETYIENSFKRKIPFLYDRKKETTEKEIIDNASKVMELVAKKLHQSNLEYVYLSDIRLKEKDNLNEWLWKITDPDAQTIEDETGHIATRSLLKRVDVPNQPGNKKWAVDFCHRSMREYFVAKSVCNMLKDSLEEAKEFLNGWFLNYEIIFFAGKIMKHQYKNFDFEPNLMNLIHRTKCTDTIEEMNLKYLGGNAVNLLYRLKGNLPGNDWSNLLLDGAILPNADLSGKNFSHTSLKHANLDNVNFTGSDFSDSNLTEVRIEETTPIQSIAIAPGEKTLALYHDGAIREWTYDRVKGQISNNLSRNIKEKGMKLIVQPGNDMTIVHDRRLYFYDRMGNELIQKADIEIKPGIKLIKASCETLLLNDESDNQSRIVLVDLDKPAVLKALTSSPYALGEHLDALALILVNEREDIHIIDLSSANKPDLIISTAVKVSCIATYRCGDMEGQYLLGAGLYNGSVQIWKIRVRQWNFEKLLEHPVHKEKQPVKDITFMDEFCVVSGGLDKVIKLLRFNHEGQVVGEAREYKMTLQCRGMKIDGVIREKVEQKKLLELLEKAK